MKKNDVNKRIEKAVGNFQPIPFYFINDDFDRKELLIQLDLMKKKGVRAFFLHVRDGILNQAFGTDVFFQNVKFVVDEAAKRNIKVWLYDEDAYPSGNCGGMICIERPELISRRIEVKKVRADADGYARLFLDSTVIGLYGYEVTSVDGVEKVVVHENCFGSVRRRWYKRVLNKHYFADMLDKPFEHIRGATSYSEIMFELKAAPNSDVYCAYLRPIYVDNRYTAYANLLDRRATDYFINKVHENYRKYLGEYFGNVIPGIFMDEPAVVPNSYCEEFDERFTKAYGYSIKGHLYKMCPDYEGDCDAFRLQYSRTVNELFERNFLTPIKEWCDNNDLFCTGHFGGEENLASQANCIDISRATKLMDIPGIDLIGSDIGDLSHVSLTLGGKVISSATWQSGKDVIACEAFALNPHNFGYRGMKLNADWLFALGVNLIIPHGFFYGYNAFQRSDAGKSFFFQDRHFDEYLKFAKYAGRVGKLLHEYRAYNDVLLVAPFGACAERVVITERNVIPANDEKSKDALDRLYDVTKMLCLTHANWDIVYSNAALESEIVDGALVVGERAYKNVIVIAGSAEEAAVYKKLRDEVENVTFCSFADSLNLKDDLIVGIAGDSHQLLTLKKSSPDGDLYFIFNNSKKYVRFKLNVSDKLTVYDAQADEYLSVTAGGELAINGYESLIVLTKNVDATKEYVIPKDCFVPLDYKDNPQLAYMPSEAQAAVTDFDLVVEKDGKQTVYEKVGFSRLRDVLGTDDGIYRDSAYLVPYFDTAPRVLAPYPIKATYVARLSRYDGGILFDECTIEGDFNLYFNGKLVEKSELKPCRVYDSSNVIFYPEWQDENVLEITFEKGEEFDGVNGEIFVMNKGI